jgi:hypothetical protein
VANSLVAVAWTYAVHRTLGTSPFLGTISDIGVVDLSAVLFAASRDALAKYYTRTERLFGQRPETGAFGDDMYNGNHHAEEAGAGKKLPKAKQAVKPPATPKASGGESNAAPPKK